MVLAGFALGRSQGRSKEMDILRDMVPQELKDILSRYERSWKSDGMFWDVMRGLARDLPWKLFLLRILNEKRF